MCTSRKFESSPNNQTNLVDNLDMQEDIFNNMNLYVNNNINNNININNNQDDMPELLDEDNQENINIHVVVPSYSIVEMIHYLDDVVFYIRERRQLIRNQEEDV